MKLAVLLGFSLLSNFAAKSAQVQPELLRLDPAIQEALRTNPEIFAAQKRYEAVRQRPAQESSLPDPMLSLSYNSSGSPRPFAGIGIEPLANAGLMISQEFLFPGKRKLRGEIAAKEADAEFQQYQMVQLSVLSRVKQAFHRLHHSYESLDVMERNRELLRKFLRVTEARYAVGKAAQQDIFKAQTQISILETRLERMRQDKRSREAELNALMNRPVDSPLPRPENLDPPPLQITLQELFESARQNSPMLMREQKMIERTQLALNLARKDHYPDYTVSGGYYYMGQMPAMYMARVDLKLPTYFWRKQRAGVAEQANTVSAAKHGLEAASQTLSFRLKDDYLMAESSYRLMNMYSTAVIPQSSLALQSSMASYETGAVDFLSLLMNFMTVLDYELNYHEELLNYHLALLRLEEMTGVELTK